jgi:hypothetical protein
VIPIRISLLTRKLMNQVFLLLMLKSSLRQSYGDHHDLVDAMEYMCHFPVLSPFMTYHRVSN